MEWSGGRASSDMMTEYINRIAPDRKHPEWHTGNLENDIKTCLTGKNLDAEMTTEQYKSLMIWHRGLALPAARRARPHSNRW